MDQLPEDYDFTFEVPLPSSVWDSALETTYDWAPQLTFASPLDNLHSPSPQPVRRLTGTDAQFGDTQLPHHQPLYDLSSLSPFGNTADLLNPFGYVVNEHASTYSVSPAALTDSPSTRAGSSPQPPETPPTAGSKRLRGEDLASSSTSDARERKQVKKECLEPVIQLISCDDEEPLRKKQRMRIVSPTSPIDVTNQIPLGEPFIADGWFLCPYRHPFNPDFVCRHLAKDGNDALRHCLAVHLPQEANLRRQGQHVPTPLLDAGGEYIELRCPDRACQAENRRFHGSRAWESFRAHLVAHKGTKVLPTLHLAADSEIEKHRIDDGEKWMRLDSHKMRLGRLRRVRAQARTIRDNRWKCTIADEILAIMDYWQGMYDVVRMHEGAQQKLKLVPEVGYQIQYEAS